MSGRTKKFFFLFFVFVFVFVFLYFDFLFLLFSFSFFSCFCCCCLLLVYPLDGSLDFVSCEISPHSSILYNPRNKRKKEIKALSLLNTQLLFIVLFNSSFQHLNDLLGIWGTKYRASCHNHVRSGSSSLFNGIRTKPSVNLNVQVREFFPKKLDLMVEIRAIL